MPTLHSSAIRAADYDPGTRRLVIQFTSGKAYTFYGVPRSIYVGLITAPSPGSYYNQFIRGNYG